MKISGLIIPSLLMLGVSPAMGASPSELCHLFGYKLAWSDEFDGDTLDRSVWNVEDNGTGCGNNELQYYIDDPANVRVADSNLVITARRSDYKGRHFTSGRLNTNEKFSFTYGVVEARIKLPKTADGLWPAFWMMGDDIKSVGWPLCGETDILEMGHFDGIEANAQDRLFNGALHWGERPDTHAQAVGPRMNPYSLQDGEYHTYFLVWTPESIKMFVDTDDAPYLDIDITSKDTPGDVGYSFHKPNFLIVNLAVGGNFPNIHDKDGVTALAGGEASMMVDYVRVYQKALPEITASLDMNNDN